MDTNIIDETYDNLIGVKPKTPASIGTLIYNQYACVLCDWLLLFRYTKPDPEADAMDHNSVILDLIMKQLNAVQVLRVLGEPSELMIKLEETIGKDYYKKCIDRTYQLISQTDILQSIDHENIEFVVDPVFGLDENDCFVVMIDHPYAWQYISFLVYLSRENLVADMTNLRLIIDVDRIVVDLSNTGAPALIRDYMSAYISIKHSVFGQDGSILDNYSSGRAVNCAFKLMNDKYNVYNNFLGIRLVMEFFLGRDDTARFIFDQNTTQLYQSIVYIIDVILGLYKDARDVREALGKFLQFVASMLRFEFDTMNCMCLTDGFLDKFNKQRRMASENMVSLNDTRTIRDTASKCSQYIRAIFVDKNGLHNRSSSSSNLMAPVCKFVSRLNVCADKQSETILVEKLCAHPLLCFAINENDIVDIETTLIQCFKIGWSKLDDYLHLLSKSEFLKCMIRMFELMDTKHIQEMKRMLIRCLPNDRVVALNPITTREIMTCVCSRNDTCRKLYCVLTGITCPPVRECVKESAPVNFVTPVPNGTVYPKHNNHLSLLSLFGLMRC